MNVIIAVFNTRQEVIPDVEGESRREREVVLITRGSARGVKGRASRVELGVKSRVGVQVFRTTGNADNLVELVLAVERNAPPRVGVGSANANARIIREARGTVITEVNIEAEGQSTVLDEGRIPVTPHIIHNHGSVIDADNT